MDISMEGGCITLPKEGLLALQDACGVRVKCARGSVWVTQESDGIDHVLFPGQWVTIDHRGKSILTALDAATVVISTKNRVAGNMAPPDRPGLVQFAVDLLHRVLQRGAAVGSHSPRRAVQPARNPPSTANSAPVM